MSGREIVVHTDKQGKIRILMTHSDGTKEMLVRMSPEEAHALAGQLTVAAMNLEMSSDRQPATASGRK